MLLFTDLLLKHYNSGYADKHVYVRSFWRQTTARLFFSINLIKDRTIYKVSFLRFGPPSKDIINIKGFLLWKLRKVFVRHLFISWTEEMLRRQLLPFWRIQIV